jgi:hypothetical protein
MDSSRCGHPLNRGLRHQMGLWDQWDLYVRFPLVP